MHAKSYSKLIHFAIFCVIVAVTARNVFAETITHENNTAPYEATDWAHQCELPKFDNSRGTLTSVVVGVAGSVQTNLAYENVNSQARSVNLNIGAKLNFTLVSGAIVEVSPVATFSNPSVGARDGVVDYAGAAGFKMGPKVGNATRSTTLTLGSDMAQYVGAGTFKLPVLAADYMSGDGTANADIVTRTEAKYSCNVQYNYTPPVAPTAAPNSAPSLAPSVLGTSTTNGGQCTNSKPSCKPDLFQADVGYNYAKLYVMPCRYDCSEILVYYGLTPEASDYNVKFATPSVDGVFSYVIHDLSPNTKYYFKLKCVNGCNSGDFGGSLQTATTSCVTSYYASGQSPSVSGACGTGGDSSSTSSVLGTTLSSTSQKSQGQTLGLATAKGGKLAATGNESVWLGAIVGSLAIATVVTVLAPRNAVRSRRRSY